MRNKGLTYFYTFCFLAFSMLLHAQDIDAYNRVYTKTYLETSRQDFAEAIRVADSLYSISETPLLKARSLMLTATLHQQRGEIIKAIEHAQKAEKTILNTDEINWKARIYGFLATQYRIARLFNAAKEYVEKAKRIAQNIENPQAVEFMMALIMQEMAYQELMHKRYDHSIAYIQQSIEHFKNSQQPHIFQGAENQQILGLCYYQLGDKDKSLEHYLHALELSKGLPENHVTALIRNGLANIYLNEKDFDQAKQHLSIAQRISDGSYYLQLKKEVNETAYQYYVEINDVPQILALKKTQDSIIAEIYKQSAEFVNASYSQLGEERRDMQQHSEGNTLFIIMGLLIVLPIVIYFVLPQFKTKQKQQVNEQASSYPIKDNRPHENKASFSVPTAEKEQQKEHVKDSPATEEDPFSSQPVISELTVSKILKRLQEFEKKQLYIKRDVSLSYLATYCDTNAKYLSIVINSHKKKDFFNYINELRINYMVEKLQENDYYRRLKIAVLAREAGFSSQSKFAMNFKKVTGLSPSEYIKSLGEEVYNNYG